MKTSRRLITSIACFCAVAALALSALLLNLRASRACSVTYSCSLFDLKLRDQDEDWRDSLRDTWCAGDMKPGDVFPFESSFVQLKQLGLICADHVEIAMSYTLRGGSGAISADGMARKMIITRCEYYNRDWKIDLLTGGYSGCPPRPDGYRAGDWTIDDVDGDGRKTFYDFKMDPLDNLPPPRYWLPDCYAPYMKLSVQFAEDAGNEYMGRSLDVVISYTLNMCSGQ